MPERARTLSDPESQRKHDSEYDKARWANDPVRQLYQTPAYKRWREFLRARNAQCQRIENGVRCLHKSEALHHLISPLDDQSLFLVATNCVMLCNHHHPGGQKGTPDWIVGVDYAPTCADIGLIAD